MRRCHPLAIPVLLGACSLAFLPVTARAQNIEMPIDTLEALLARHEFTLQGMQDTRFEGDRTQQVMLRFAEGSVVFAKWAKAARGGETFNNNPRYELAAYEVQKLFLDNEELVVPPTRVRALPLDWYEETVGETEATFDDTRSVIVVLQYWLSEVGTMEALDESRLDTDDSYARAAANLNLLTHLIRHRDSNVGNFLLSDIETEPRMFSVDNGVSFRSPPSNRGAEWEEMRVERLPAGAVTRLRAVTRDDLREQFGVLAEFRVQADGTLLSAPPGPNIDDGDGIRSEDGVVQFGLTRREIDEMFRRIEDLLEKVDRGDYEMIGTSTALNRVSLRLHDAGGPGW